MLLTMRHTGANCGRKGSMYFSELYSISDVDQYNWFDPLLEMDSRLFVDPFLIFQEVALSPWASAHDELVQYFQSAYELLAGHQNNPESLQYRKTLQLVTFPEPPHFGLGFAKDSTDGAGTGKGFSRLIVRAMSEAINRGLEVFKHFEELGLLVEKIGRDRISDITCNILIRRFVSYTQEQCRALEVPLVGFELERGEFDPIRNRWTSKHVKLPANPFGSRGVLLTPKRFLRELPALNVDDWWEYVEPELRDDLNLAINQKLSKREIIRLARERPELIRRWSQAREGRRVEAYPVDRDPEGLHNWQAQGSAIAAQYPLAFSGTPSSSAELSEFVAQMIAMFKWQIEECGLWSLMFNDDSGKPKKEVAIQLLFAGLTRAYCDAHGVRADREVQLGRGPVDFAFSGSNLSRVLLEVKKMTNGEYWNGLEEQLTSYLRSDRCEVGWFVAVRLGDTATQKQRTMDLSVRTAAAAAATGFNLLSDWVDGRPKESASNLRSGSEGTKPGGADDEFPAV